MGRTRSCKPDFDKDLTLASVCINARYMYRSMWNYMDRNGVIEADPRLIRANVFPYDDFTVAQVQGWLDELIAVRRLFPFEHEGKRYFFCPTFLIHQNFHPNERPKYGVPPHVLLQSVQKLTGKLPVKVEKLIAQADTDTVTDTDTPGTGGSDSGVNLELPDLGEAQAAPEKPPSPGPSRKGTGGKPPPDPGLERTRKHIANLEEASRNRPPTELVRKLVTQVTGRDTS